MIWTWIAIGLVVLLVVLLVLGYNRLVRLRTGGQHRLVEHRRPARAARRPDPQPRRDGEGLRRARARRLRARDRGASRAAAGRLAPGGRRGRRPPRRRARPAVRGRRGVPRAEGVGELPPPAGRAHRHRGQDQRRPPLLQRDGDARTTRAIQSVPAVFYARPLGFREREFFSADDDAREVPEVQLTSS